MFVCVIHSTRILTKQYTINMVKISFSYKIYFSLQQKITYFKKIKFEILLLFQQRLVIKKNMKYFNELLNI
jgi:hypothetical protein